MVITRTPFRISFFGGGTDYPFWYKKYGGSVISSSIDKYCYITLRYLPPFFRYKYRIRYTKREHTWRIEKIKHPSVRECLKYLNVTDGIEMVHTSDLPAMSGLGSSSSFTVGFLYALYALTEKSRTKDQLAREAIHVEQNLIKESVGSQDQVIAAHGGFNRIDFLPTGEIKIYPLNIEQNRLNLLQDHLMLFFTGFQRKASDIASKLIRNGTKKEKELRQISEIMEEAFKILTNNKQDFNDFGRLLDHHWKLKRRLASDISTPAIDEIYETAKNGGAIGGKVLGAGGGGFMLFFVNPEDKIKLKKKLKKLLYVPFNFENQGTQIIYQMPSVMDNGYKG